MKKVVKHEIEYNRTSISAKSFYTYISKKLADKGVESWLPFYDDWASDATFGDGKPYVDGNGMRTIIKDWKYHRYECVEDQYTFIFEWEDGHGYFFLLEFETVEEDAPEEFPSICEFNEKYLGTCDGNLLADEYNKYFHENVRVGDGATVTWWSDAEAYTVIKKTACTLTLRRCKATLKDSFKPEFVPGGFFGRVVNQSDQEYDYAEDPDGSIVVAHWSKKECRYKWNGLLVIPGRHEFYDYNF